MTTTITATSSGQTTSPVLITGYRVDQRSPNIVHNLIAGGIAVTLLEANPRSGTLELVYADAASADAARAMHAAADTFTLERSDIATLAMTYVVAGTLSLAVDPTGAAWVLSVGFQEVIP